MCGGQHPLSLPKKAGGELWAGGNAGATGFLLTIFSTSAVRNPVDEYVGSDYSLLNDPHVTPENIDLDLKVPAECPVQRVPLWQESPAPGPGHLQNWAT